MKTYTLPLALLGLLLTPSCHHHIGSAPTPHYSHEHATPMSNLPHGEFSHITPQSNRRR